MTKKKLFKKTSLAASRGSDRVKDFEISGPEMPTDQLARQMEGAGFQASELAKAVQVLKEMKRDEECTVFLAFTANMVASGLRGVFAKLVRDGFCDAIITTGGSVDHDIIKCYDDYLLGSFAEDDIGLHRKGVNRIGNILVPNDRYVLFEEKVQPVLEKCYEEKKTWNGRELVERLAKELCMKDKNSVLKACVDKKVPVFSPGLIDSALGLNLYQFKTRKRDFALDAVGDMEELDQLVFARKRTGALVCGGGISKHYTIACNLLKGGLDYSVYVTTASEYDGSLSGAPAREAKSWGKIKEKGTTATVVGDATIVLPLIVAGI